MHLNAMLRICPIFWPEKISDISGPAARARPRAAPRVCPPPYQPRAEKPQPKMNRPQFLGRILTLPPNADGIPWRNRVETSSPRPSPPPARGGEGGEAHGGRS